MLTSAEFALNFEGKPVPPALEKLLVFQNETGFEYYAQGFGLLRDDKSGLVHGWSPAPEFLGKLMPFAQANGSGSFYALWQYDESLLPEQLPVVIFGDEGGEYVVAENITGLLQLLTIDAEALVYEGVSFYKDEEDDYESESADDYKAWLQEHFGLSPVREAEGIVEAAQLRFQAAFDEWKGAFFG